MDDCKNKTALETLVSIYRQILKFEAMDIENWLRLAVSLNILGNQPESTAAFSQAKQCHKGDAWNAYVQGVEFLFTGQTALAVDAQQKAQRLAPNSPIQRQWAALNLEFCALGGPESIVAASRQLLAFAPENTAAWRSLALALVPLSEHQEAAEAMKKCVTLAPEDPACWRDYIDILWHPDQASLRLEAHRRYLELAPGDIAGWNHYANSLRSDGQLKEEIEVSEKIVRLAPEDVSAWTRLSDVYGRAGLHHKKLRAYRYSQKLQSALSTPSVQMELF